MPEPAQPTPGGAPPNGAEPIAGELAAHQAEGALYTDLYQLTMAQLYFREGLHDRRAQFDYFFRSYPDYGSHQAGYCISAGLADLLVWMSRTTFESEEIAYLRSLRGNANGRLFQDDFLSWLEGRGFGDIELDAVPEGRVVHPNVPLAVARGPLAMAQILETSLLNHLNYPTLVATKACRIREAGRGRPVLEFGLRRAQSRAATAGARAALIGGADNTSYVGLSRAAGIDPQGTHAHSMVQAFMGIRGSGAEGDSGAELASFRAYAAAYPDDCLLLVDTIDTLASGLPNAIRVFEELRESGHRPLGVRLDSGDLAHLAVRAASMLNAAGFPSAAIVLSNQLDELTLTQILTQVDAEAAGCGLDPKDVVGRLVYGVGTRLITSRGDCALDGVYKLVGIDDAEGEPRPAIKISESAAKTPNPGPKRAWRIHDRRGMATADLLTLSDDDPVAARRLELRHPTDHARRRVLHAGDIARSERLLEPAWRGGAPAREVETLDRIRRRRDSDLAVLDPGVRRLLNPHRYHVSLDADLWDLKQTLIRRARASLPDGGSARDGRSAGDGEGPA